MNLLAIWRALSCRPPKQAAVRPPAPDLIPASPFTPTATPPVANDPWDAEVLRQWAHFARDGSSVAAFEAHLRWTDTYLTKELAELESQFARQSATPRFKP